MKVVTSMERRADAPHAATAADAPRVPARAPAATRMRWMPWMKPVLWLVAISVAGIAVYLNRDQLLALTHSPATSTESKPPETGNKGPWDGFVTLPAESQTALGLTTTAALPQTKPIELPLLGTTKHDETRITKIRPLFRGRVEKIHVDVGQKIEKGTPVVELYSAELARAKTDFTIQRSQWNYQKKLLEARNELVKTGAISKNLVLETENNEMREHHEYEVAREKLQLFGLSNQEIDDIDQAQGPEQARLTLRSPAAGVVIRRDVVSGNIYTEADELLAVAPGDHLWVSGVVFENDLDLVSLGQKWNVEFPFLHQTVSGKVEYISQNVDPEVHAVRIRTTIPNADGRLKADMLVRGNLEIAPQQGNVNVPRSSLVVIDGQTCVYVRVPGQKDKFARHLVSTVYEHDDEVVIREGLTAGEEVVVTGGLILQQLYQDAAQQNAIAGSADQ
jgi:cobalt-zinc-cadmium efflux system membrane fusion protein